MLDFKRRRHVGGREFAVAGSGHHRGQGDGPEERSATPIDAYMPGRRIVAFVDSGSTYDGGQPGLPWRRPCAREAIIGPLVETTEPAQRDQARCCPDASGDHSATDPGQDRAAPRADGDRSDPRLRLLGHARGTCRPNRLRTSCRRSRAWRWTSTPARFVSRSLAFPGTAAV
ncbi:hypothetical protein ACRAWD_09845 [Caulobacter segnis]